MDLQDRKVHKGSRVHKVLKDLQVTMVCRDLLDLWVVQALLDLLDLWALLDLMEPVVTQATQGQRANLVHQEQMEVQVSKDHLGN